MGLNCLVCDGNNILAAQTHTHLSLTIPGTGKSSGGVYGFLRKLRSMLLHEIADDIVFGQAAVAFDAGRPAFRSELLSGGYKAKRDADRKEREKSGQEDPYLLAYQSGKKHLGMFLKCLGVDILRAPGFEADDLVGAVAFHKRIHPKAPLIHRLVLVSGDDDYLQLASKEDRVWVYQPTPKKMYKYSASWFLIAKSLQGDKSDEIPGIPGIGEIKAAAIAEYLLSVPGNLTKFPYAYAGPHANVVAKCPEAGAILRRNMQVMNLGYTAKDAFRAATWEKGCLDIKRFRELCAEWGFDSILEDFDRFTEIFRVMHKRGSDAR